MERESGDILYVPDTRSFGVGRNSGERRGLLRLMGEDLREAQQSPWGKSPSLASDLHWLPRSCWNLREREVRESTSG